MNQDNTVRIANRTLQIEKSKWRGTLAKCRVLVCEHLDATWSVYYGPHWWAATPRTARPQATLTARFSRGNPAPPAGFPLPAASPADKKSRYYYRTNHVLIHPDISMC